MPLRTVASHLLIYDPDHHSSIVHADVASATPLETHMLGTLFFLVEIEKENKAGIELIQSLQQEVAATYYRSEDLHIEQAFERALQRANETVHAVLGRETQGWLPRFHCIIGVLKDSMLHFTIVGGMHAFLVHRQRILNILDTPDGQRDEADPLKIFSTIVSGELQAGDTALFCTTSILDHLSQEKIRRLFMDRNPEQGLEQLETLLSSAEGPTPFGAVALKLLEAPAQAQSAEAIELSGIRQPQDSMAALIQKERNTNSLLNHSMWPTLGRSIKKEMSEVAKKMSGNRSEEPTRPPIAKFQEPSPGRNAIRLIGAGLVSLFWILMTGTTKSFQWVWRAAGKGEGNRTLARGTNWVASLTPNRRRVLLAATILLILFAQSIVSLGERREQSKRDEQYRNAINTAKEKNDAAEAALLIQNESGARKLLAEALDLLETVPEGARSLRDDVAEVRDTIVAKQQTLRHASDVSVETLFDIGTLAVDVRLSSLGATDTQFVTFHSEDDSIYQVDAEDSSGSTLLETPSIESHLARFISGITRTMYVLQKNGQLQQIDFSGKKLVPVSVAYENVERDIRDAALYNNRLYTLDALNNQVFRHDGVASGFGIGASWLRANHPDIKDGVSMAIDGSVYVLKADGNIVKFSAGAEQDVTFDPVDPVLSSPSILRLNTNSLFVLDASNKRIIEFSKDGALKKQHVNDAFADAKDFVVNEKDVTVLSGTRLLRFRTE